MGRLKTRPATRDGQGLLPLDAALARQLEDPAFRAEWERTAVARAVALRVLQYRIGHGLSQTALARRLRMQQPAVARLEAGEHLPTLDTLARLARELGLAFDVEVTPQGVRLRDSRAA